MGAPYPPIEPYDHGMLDVGDGNLVYWETCGNPDGKPAVVVHGGPGSGCTVNPRKNFDPERYRIILFDQRGCGRSLPHAADPATDMSVNTTEHLIGDMEKLREHLGVQRWLIYGGSWGVTLALAYAQRFPERVSEMVLLAVSTTRRHELSWLYGGVRRFFPEAYERFRDAVPEADRDGDLITAYARMMEDPDPDVRIKAAQEWCLWEDTVLSLEPNGSPSAFIGRPSDSTLALVRIITHYYSNAGWLEEGALIRNAHRLKGIPGVVIHGRQDLSCPAETAHELAAAWPDAELHIVDQAGHKGGGDFPKHLFTALDRFATT
ncbi:prolyl aminopeptidase [Allokutzneria sp. A3M-2-11 16]|uniref:prolyl aminopeptidase n=1 Tax=Allokutzneria sp. A3M-2-11 16 TaxID=2962043 RepID=UPI0020B83AA3|nr:prolyl aminopeptidase [Allokutzneria sp. A3M-2-11 16]MCP3798736.1 prolyl aminopeptidase [Allokutzneria sp. A3M-2-11 16]